VTNASVREMFVRLATFAFDAVVFLTIVLSLAALESMLLVWRVSNHCG
jgi:hypothetical protein